MCERVLGADTINKLLVVDGHTTDLPYEPKVAEMVLIIDSRVWVDLQSVVIAMETYYHIPTIIMYTYLAEYSNSP